MRIHPINETTTGQVWQVFDRARVRRVLIRAQPIAGIFAVSWHKGEPVQTAAGLCRLFTHRTSHASISDLFHTEQDARLESTRRDALLREASGLPARRGPAGVFAPVDSALASVAVALAFLMALI